MTFVQPETVLNSSFLNRIVSDDEEGFLIRGNHLSATLLRKALKEVLFVLPIRHGYYLPNPRHRFCLDLRKDINWFRNRKLRRLLPHFYVSVKRSCRAELQMARAYHLDMDNGSWLSDELIDLLDSIAVTEGNDSDMQLFCFSLVEKSTERVAACTFGFASGGVFEDYTMCTLIKDDRSLGSVLNKLVGLMLQQAGISLWYWGYEVKYMKEYISHYGAGLMERREFYDVWKSQCSTRIRPFADLKLPDGLELRVL
jgi:hypothetical protein